MPRYYQYSHVILMKAKGVNCLYIVTHTLPKARRISEEMQFTFDADYVCQKLFFECITTAIVVLQLLPELWYLLPL